MTLYTTADLARHCGIKNSAMVNRYRRDKLPAPVARTASGNPLWSTKQANEIRDNSLGEVTKNV